MEREREMKISAGRFLSSREKTFFVSPFSRSRRISGKESICIGFMNFIKEKRERVYDVNEDRVEDRG